MKKLLMTVAIAAPLALSLTLASGGGVEAKITPVPTSCENKGGQEPGGQQPECKGGGLVQQKENQNPAGKAPPGQNP